MASREDGMVGGVIDGRYRLDSLMREGRFGDFWRATRVEDGVTVAVKLLRPELFLDERGTARFERELRVFTTFRHPNLLGLLDHGRLPTGVPWIVTDYRDGRLLADEVASLALTAKRVCHVGAQIADVLAAAHARGIVHRGLDPEAILLCEEDGDPDRVKVLDFGLAYLDTGGAEPRLTRVGERLGRCEYMAPEYIQDLTLDARSDLYVLGILLFEMLVGQPPFVGRSLTVLNQQVEAEPWAPSDMADQAVPEWLDVLVLALLAKSPGERPQTGDVVAVALRQGASALA